MDMLTNPTFSWLPWTVFGVLMFLAAIRGFWQGWKSATYFLVFNIVFVVAGIISLVVSYDMIVDAVTGMMPTVEIGSGSGGASPDTSAMIKVASDSIKPIIWEVALVAVIIVGYILSSLIYWFFRGKLKRTIRENKKEGLSNTSARFIGAGVGVVTMLPFAAFASSISAIASPKESYNEFLSYLTKGLSATQIDDSEGANDSARHLLGLVDEDATNALTVITDFMGKPQTPITPAQATTLQKGKELIENILNDKRLATKEFFDAMFKGIDIPSTPDLSTVGVSITFSANPKNKLNAPRAKALIIAAMGGSTNGNVQTVINAIFN